MQVHKTLSNYTVCYQSIYFDRGGGGLKERDKHV